MILADTMTHLNGITVNTGGPVATVTAGAGASIEAIVTELQKHDLGWATSPLRVCCRSVAPSRSTRTVRRCRPSARPRCPVTPTVR